MDILEKINDTLDEAKEYPSIDELGNNFYDLPEDIRKIIERLIKLKLK